MTCARSPRAQRTTCGKGWVRSSPISSIEDLNPKRFVQKHFLDDLNGDSARNAAQPSSPTRANGTLLAPGERPPFDSDAT